MNHDDWTRGAVSATDRAASLWPLAVFDTKSFWTSNPRSRVIRYPPAGAQTATYNTLNQLTNLSGTALTFIYYDP